MADSPGDKTLVRSKSGLRIVALNDRFESPFSIQEPPWVPDSECSSCMKCKTKFDFMKRRHHCRRCGQCYCNKCCETMTPLPRMSFVDPVRHCEPCSLITRKENEFYDKHLKVLLTGAQMHMFYGGGGADQENQNDVAVARLSSDHRSLVFESMHKDVGLTSITSFTMLTTPDQQGNNIAHGVEILYQPSDAVDGEEAKLRLEAPHTGQRKQSQTWAVALQKAYILMGETLGKYENA